MDDTRVPAPYRIRRFYDSRLGWRWRVQWQIFRTRRWSTGGYYQRSTLVDTWPESLMVVADLESGRRR